MHAAAQVPSEKLQSIRFKTTLFKIGSWTILKLPLSASAKLPSRGQTMVICHLNGVRLRTPLEPDGKGSHWFRVDKALLARTDLAADTTVNVTILPVKDWPEPVVPPDLKSTLLAVPKAQALWKQITPLARWEWIRWIRATGQSETHQRRVEIACSKLQGGMRRPCCWNRNLCTEPTVSKNGVLLDPTRTIGY